MSWFYMWFGRHSCDGFVCLYPTKVFSPLPLRPSSGIELVSAAALLLLFILNLLLIGRQQRLKSSEMVRRLKTIISKLDGKSTLTPYPGPQRGEHMPI